MISTRTSLDEKAESLKETLAREYTLAIRSVCDYAVDVDAALADGFRNRLRELESRVAQCSTSEELDEIQSGFRGELREYRDQTAERIRGLRAEIAAAADAVDAMASNVSLNSKDLEMQVGQEIAQLEEVAEGDDLEEIRRSVRETGETLRRTCEELRQNNHATIAQLQDEIRSLHREIAEERRALFTDPVSGAWVRRKLEERVEDLLRQGDVFGVLLIRFNLYELERRFPREALQEMMRALVRRLGSALGEEATVTRWSENVFAAAVEKDPGALNVLAAEVRRKISGTYVITERGSHYSLEAVFHMASVSKPKTMSEQDFHFRLGQVASILECPGWAHQ